jgi:hypothetical protein
MPVTGIPVTVITILTALLTLMLIPTLTIIIPIIRIPRVITIIPLMSLPRMTINRHRHLEDTMGMESMAAMVDAAAMKEVTKATGVGEASDTANELCNKPTAGFVGQRRNQDRPGFSRGTGVFGPVFLLEQRR